jgi:sugar-specific transcriptional regulator TrmB
MKRRYWPKGWWCPRHPWPPAWARKFGHPTLYYVYIDPSEELKMLEDLKNNLEMELAEITKHIEELKRQTQEKK